MKRDILSQIERKTKRTLTDEERAAIANLLLAERFEQIEMPKDHRGRLRVFEKARRKARREAIRATAR
jgi:ubiquinone biosynthesis protein UbiJ